MCGCAVTSRRSTVGFLFVGPEPLFMQHSVSTILLIFPSLLPWSAPVFHGVACCMCVYVVDSCFSINSGGGFGRTSEEL